MGWGKVLQCLKGQGWGNKIFSVIRGRVGIGQDKSCGAGVKTPSFEPTLPYCHPYA